LPTTSSRVSSPAHGGHGTTVSGPRFPRTAAQLAAEHQADAHGFDRRPP
jgi:hypothetical protein